MSFVWVVHGEEHAEMCRLSQACAKQGWPFWPCTAYVDKPYGLEGEIVVPGYHDVPFMLMNVLCQYRHLVEVSLPGRLWSYFLDADALPTRRDVYVRPDGVDVIATWREGMGDLSDRMPYNYGVVIAAPTIGAVSAWAWMADRITRMSPQNQKWYGNQIALRELLGPPQKDGTPVSRRHAWFDVTSVHLPCETYNWSPEGPDESIDGKFVVHLKGDKRKDLVAHYADRILA